MICTHWIKVFFPIIHLYFQGLESRKQKELILTTGTSKTEVLRVLPSILCQRMQMEDEWKDQDPDRNETALRMGKENKESTAVWSQKSTAMWSQKKDTVFVNLKCL